MMRIGTTLALGLLGGCMATPPTGFDAIAARGDVIDVAVPLWMDGGLTVGVDGQGRVTRRAVGREEARTAFGVTEAVVDRYGRMHFDVAGTSVGGQLTGDCVYNRSEAQLKVPDAGVEAAAPVEPLRLRCSFARGGVGVGTMTLDAVPRREGLVTYAQRIGEVRMGSAAIDLRSMHRVGGGRGVPTDTAVGYEFVTTAGRSIGGVNINGVRKRQLVLPVAGPERDAALAGGLALAVFWDPGDTDD